METENGSVSRKKFVLWSAGLLSIITAARYFFRSGARQNSTSARKSVKMLTQDGQLVEIQQDAIPEAKRKITNSELKVWVKNKTAIK